MTIIREERIGNQRLILGNCHEVMPMLGRVDAVVTDPPYGIGEHGGGFRGRKGQSIRVHQNKGWDKRRPDQVAQRDVVRQRQPRIEYPTHLAYVRTLPCQICKRPGSEAAHLRTPAPHHGKRDLGMQEKADDCWVLPLCHFHHMQQHDRGDELAWWASYGIDDPHALAIDLFAKSPSAPKPRQKRERRTPPRKPPEQRRSIPKGPPLKSANRLPGKGQMKFPRRSREGLT